MKPRSLLLTIGAGRHYKHRLRFYAMRGRLCVLVSERPMFQAPKNGCVWHQGARMLEARRADDRARLFNARHGHYGGVYG